MSVYSTLVFAPKKAPRALSVHQNLAALRKERRFALAHLARDTGSPR
jgi:hypothetical protein